MIPRRVRHTEPRKRGGNPVLNQQPLPGGLVQMTRFAHLLGMGDLACIMERGTGENLPAIEGSAELVAHEVAQQRWRARLQEDLSTVQLLPYAISPSLRALASEAVFVHDVL